MFNYCNITKVLFHRCLDKKYIHDSPNDGTDYCNDLYSLQDKISIPKCCNDRDMCNENLTSLLKAGQRKSFSERKMKCAI